MSRLANVGLGDRGANRATWANRANPPPSDPAPARQVTFQVTLVCGGGLTGLTGGWGWGGEPGAL